MQGQARGEVINYLRFTWGQEQALNRVVLIPSMPLRSSWAGLSAALRADHTFSHLCVFTSAVLSLAGPTPPFIPSPSILQSLSAAC